MTMVDNFEKIKIKETQRMYILWVFLCIRIYTLLQLFIRNMHTTIFSNIPESCIAITAFCNTYMYCIYMIHSWTSIQMLEPYDTFWISVAYIEDNTNKYIDDYTPLHLLVENAGFDETCRLYQNAIQLTTRGFMQTHFEKLVLLRHTDTSDPKKYDTTDLKIHSTFIFAPSKLGVKYISRICKSGEEYVDLKETNEIRAYNSYMQSLIPCPKFFLTIMYNHPKMNTSIQLDTGISLYYYVNNEILSPVFILRFLKYQPLPFVFDSDYSVEIIDCNINIFNLYSNMYIKLGESAYEVLNI